MNAPAFSPMDRQAVELGNPCHWHRTDEARALLADCRANPPKLIVHKLQPHERWTRDDEVRSFYDTNDERVDRLSKISSRAWGEAYVAGVPKDDLIARWPDVDSEIRKAIGRGRIAPFARALGGPNG